MREHRWGGPGKVKCRMDDGRGSLVDTTCGEKGGDVGQRDVRTGHGRDVGVDVRLVGMGWLEGMVGGRRGD